MVGVELDYHWIGGETGPVADTSILRQPTVTPTETFGFHRLEGLAYVQASTRLDMLRGTKLEMAVQLAFGGGGVFWTLRDATEVGSVLTLRPGLVFDWYFDHFAIGFRFAVPFMWMHDLGSGGLSHSPTMAAELTLQTGVRS